MAKLHEKIMSMRFKHIAKAWVALALAVALIGGGASAALLAPQINEAVTYARSVDEQENAQAAGETQQPINEQQGEENGHREHGKRYERDLENIPFTEPSTAAKIAAGVTALLALALGAAYWLLCAAWLYRAAVVSDMDGRLWLLLGLLGNLAAIILFWVVRCLLRAKCPQCGTWQKRGNYCARCGAQLVRYCPSCGTKVAAKDLFCQHCGVKLEKESEEAKT